MIQRGNIRSVCFAHEQDFSAYAHWLKEYATEHNVAVHAWVFMTNHMHLLETPEREAALSLMMQSLGRRYVRYFNHQYRRSGTFWVGRFKSSVVQTESYLLQCYRYVELNPVRASMVEDPVEYPWSSYRCNGLGIESSLCSTHDEYIKLGINKTERTAAYRRLFQTHVYSALLTEIRNAVNKGLALGGERFKNEVETLYGRRVKWVKMGRPAKSFI